MGKMRKVYSTKFVGKSKGRGTVNRANNKINFRQVGYGCEDSINQNRNRNQWSAYLNKEMKMKLRVL